MVKNKTVVGLNVRTTMVTRRHVRDGLEDSMYKAKAKACGVRGQVKAKAVDHKHTT